MVFFQENYGEKTSDPNNPTTRLQHWKDTCKTEKAIHKNNLATKGDPDCPKLWPGLQLPNREECMKRGNYFSDYKEKIRTDSEYYNLLFHLDYSVNAKLHREDKKHKVGLKLGEEDFARTVPVRASGVIGHYWKRSPLLDALRVDGEGTEKNRYKNVCKGFYRNNGTSLKMLHTEVSPIGTAASRSN